MNPLAIIINVVLILISIVLIVAVLMQQGQRQGLGAIGGGAETFFGKNKSKGYEARMAKITKIGAAVFIVLAMVATILTARSTADKPSLDEALQQIQQELSESGIESEFVDEGEVDPAEAPVDEVPATEVPADDAVEAPAEPNTDAPDNG